MHMQQTTADIKTNEITLLTLGRVHTDTSTSPSVGYTSVHVFQRRPFTLIRVLYVLYGLPL